MESKSKIYEIRSKYILKHIINFIQNKNIVLKLFFLSKNFQNKLNINYSDCYEKYLKELNFDINEYVFKSEELNAQDILKKKYDDFISKNKLNKKEFEKIIFEVINNKNKENEENEEKYINIDSPLFEISSKTKYFDKIYTINLQK